MNTQPNKLSNNQLFQFSCNCLALDEFPKNKIFIQQYFTEGKVDIDSFIRLCSKHLVLPAMVSKFQKHQIFDLFNDEYAQHLTKIYQLNLTRNREILLQIEEISKILKNERIEPVYLKGTANLMDKLYADSGERMIGDIDFLVREEDYLRTAALVKKLGYKSDAKVYGDILSLKHYPRLFREDVPADVEIHRMPVQKKYSKQFYSELIFQKKKKIHSRENCFVPSDEHKLIHTFIHGPLNDQEYRFKRPGLRNLYDFYLLSKRVKSDEIIDLIEEKQKAQIYAAYNSFLFSSLPKQNSKQNKHPQHFADRHAWYLDHPKQHHSFVKRLKLSDLIFHRYLGRIAKAFFQKESLQYIFIRLKDPQWYKAHTNGLRRYFH